MGILEQEARRRRRLGYLQRTILGVIAISGLLLVAAVAPKVLQLFGNTTIGRRFSERMLAALSRLAKSGLVKFEEKNGKRYVRITEKGREAIALEQGRLLLQTTHKRRWDRRYRLVMFDIAEKRRNDRIRLREMMRSAGFLRLQDSVWIYPHDCEDFVALIKADLKIGREVLYIIAEKVENDRWLRQEFNLPRN